MHNNLPIIVSMTSYPKRITNVCKSIFLLLDKQTVKPDEIHLWLSTEEFPNKEKDLPQDLRLCIETVDILHLHWLSKNTYVHKRHEIFRNLKKSYVFLIDDDTEYKSNLIESTLKMADEHPNTIINYAEYGLMWFSKKHQVLKMPSLKTPTYKNRWCGQSMIPSWIYPAEVFTPENIDLRDEICSLSDESWLSFFIVKNHIPVICNDSGWGKELNKKNCNAIGIFQKVVKLDKDGLNFRDIAYIKLFNYIDVKEIYIKEFNYDME